VQNVLKACVQLLIVFGAALQAWAADPAVERYLYVGAPGIEAKTELGGQGVLVFDIDHNHRFVKRIDSAAGKEKPMNIKGICASAATGRLYETTPAKLYCVDLLSEQNVWEKDLPKGCDRMSITPDGKTLYVPAFEKDFLNVIDAATGDLITSINVPNGSHNCVCQLEGQRIYLGCLKSPIMSVIDPATNAVVNTVQPFGNFIRPYTINAANTRCYVCVNGLLGFEIGDLTNGKILSRVEVTGFEKGSVKRHGCPSHGIALRPDEKEIWLCDGHNSQLHVFDISTDPPTQIKDISLREQPGWVTFTINGDFAYSSTGEVIDPQTKQIVVALADEEGRPVHSEKMVEIDFKDGKPIRVGDQFGLGRENGVASSDSHAK
jgi:DNA-binding beta-propeller fold protein YncE